MNDLAKRSNHGWKHTILADNIRSLKANKRSLPERRKSKDRILNSCTQDRTVRLFQSKDRILSTIIL